MTKFFAGNFSAFFSALAKFNALQDVSFFEQCKYFYRVLYYLMYVLDVGIVVIAYAVATRWLDNRSKSVESTFYGWFVALACYPPMNSGFTREFINYRGQPSLSLPDSLELVLMIVVLFLYVIHLWAALAMGFRFSNLTNRGLVTIGPYAYVRHPSYASKNFAWWLDNLQVLQNGWTTFALAAWNWIYIQRALTEERHLSQDSVYRAYCQRVPDRFIPRLLFARWRVSAGQGTCASSLR